MYKMKTDLYSLRRKAAQNNQSTESKQNLQGTSKNK